MKVVFTYRVDGVEQRKEFIGEDAAADAYFKEMRSKAIDFEVCTYNHEYIFSIESCAYATEEVYWDFVSARDRMLELMWKGTKVTFLGKFSS